MLRLGLKITIRVADERRNPFGVLFISATPSLGSRGWHRDNPGLADGTASPYVTAPITARHVARTEPPQLRQAVDPTK